MQNLKLGDKVQIARYKDMHNKGIGYISYIDKDKCCVSDVPGHISKPDKGNVFKLTEVTKFQ